MRLVRANRAALEKLPEGSLSISFMVDELLYVTEIVYPVKQ